MTDFSSFIEPTAKRLLGEATSASSRELRFGTNGSLKVNIAGEAKGTWKDFEADTGGGVIDLVKHVNGGSKEEAVNWLKSEFGDFAGQPHVSSKGKVVAEYDYRNEAGELLYQVVRMEPKTFRQRRPLPNGGWEWKVKGTRLIPYRLTELTEALALERPVYIVEGEKDVDRLASLGIVATCNPGGAKKWPNHFADYFKGARVFILPDNDEAGSEHRDIVAKNLREVAERVAVVRLPNLQAKGDVSDWLDQGGTVEAFNTATETAETWRPTRTHFPTIWFGEEDNAPPRSWLIKNILASGEMSVLFGPSGVGKSFMAIDLGLRIAADMEWFDNRVKTGTVAYIAGEGATGARQRLKAWRERHGITERIPFAMIPTALDMRTPESPVSQLANDIASIGEMAGAPVSLIIIDTLSRMMAGGTDADPRDMAAFIVNVEELRKKTNAHILIVHHTGKDKERGMRGASTLRDCADTVIELERIGESETCLATIDKQKDGEDGQTFRFTLSQTVLGLDEDGDEITSCVIEPADTGETERGQKPRLPASQEIAMRALQEAVCVHGQKPPITPEEIPKDVNTITIECWRQQAYQMGISPTGSSEARRKAFNRAFQGLQLKGRIGVYDPYVWIP
ncbi:AAA family ATPase [Pseudovibrio sp. Alg231-02]|uniref:AAA family ATPase n=1 Tax=Pseudovibrio sp. Alg231-02 TaxID=1922223 RepID=UPI000D5607F5|nr:AAA family ATPase [Pseudovibrio sp. Alg231-02]